MDQQAFLNLLATASKYGASDVHLHPGSAPAFRIKGDIITVKMPPITEADLILGLRTMIADQSVHAKLNTLQDFDGSFEIPGVCRFRYNVFRYRGKLGAILRLIPSVIPTIDGLGLPAVLKKIAAFNRGLVLVTGATGSGKSSTLAAMINQINETISTHILTIEDPVEFVHTPKKSRFTQREIGPDSASFAFALRAALRQDPDVILVGEMRDPETIDIALKAAETGHLVFSTVHTQDAAKTIGRLISVFKPEEQRMVRQRLADNLMGTVSQRLVKRIDGKGMIAAQEIMVINKSIQECIEDPARTAEMQEYISKSREISGGQTFDQHLAEIYQAGIVTFEAALEASSNPSDFQRNAMYGPGSGSKQGAGAAGMGDEVPLDLPPKEEEKEEAPEPAKTTTVTKVVLEKPKAA